jgi:hypothetical protein
MPAPIASWVPAPIMSMRPRSVSAGSSVSEIRSTPAGSSPSPSRQRSQAATVGQVTSTAVEPTTRPKCPAFNIAS